MRILKCTGVLVLLLSNISYSQEIRDTLQLNNVEVVSSRLKSYGTANKVVSVLSRGELAKNQTSLRQLLTSQAAVNIRAYGVSGLSTISFRGTGSNHSAIFWEGVNLQSPMNGGLDLTLLPVSFIDDVQLQMGASGALFGAGTLGGSVQLKSSTPTFENKGISVSVDQQVGSFGQRYQGGRLSIDKNHFQLNLRVFRNSADNNFEFYNRFIQQNETQQNAAIDQHGVLIEPSFKVGKKGVVKAKYWFQDNSVQIPKTASEGLENEGLQKDKFHRSVITYTTSTRKIEFKALTSFINHELTFNQAASNISNSWISEIQADINVSKGTRMQVGINNTYEEADVQNYAANESVRNQTAAFVSVKKLLSNKLEATFSAREVFVDGDFTPFVPSLGLELFINQTSRIKAKAARSFRLPTFNDLYWVSGTDNGNPNLKAEDGLNLELGYAINYKTLSLELTAYSNYIDNWIQWRPNEQGNWSPINIVTAWTRGIEASGTYSHRFTDDWSFTGRLNYTFTRATNEKVNGTLQANEEGKELIYVPGHQGSASATVNWRNAFLLLNQTYTGQQFTTSDNNSRWALEAFSLLDTAIGYSTSVRNHTVSISLRINNVLDQEYEVRSAYPMPGINYNLNLNYTFN